MVDVASKNSNSRLHIHLFSAVLTMSSFYTLHFGLTTVLTANIANTECLKYL